MRAAAKGGKITNTMKRKKYRWEHHESFALCSHCKAGFAMYRLQIWPDFWVYSCQLCSYSIVR